MSLMENKAMAQRTWFTMENTTIDGMTKTDLRILNLATRRLFDVKAPPTREDLTTIRSLYRKGMSGTDLIEAFEQTLPP